MAAGVVSDLVKVAIGTTVDVTSHRGGLAITHSHRSVEHLIGERMLPAKAVKVPLQEGLNRQTHSSIRTDQHSQCKFFIERLKRSRVNPALLGTV
jgi:hypothetical protein